MNRRKKGEGSGRTRNREMGRIGHDVGVEDISSISDAATDPASRRHCRDANKRDGRRRSL